jgi:hypothetical protein
MSFTERNQYQAFLMKLLSIKEPDEVYSFGERFASIEKSLNRCPTPWEVVNIRN